MNVHLAVVASILVVIANFEVAVRITELTGIECLFNTAVQWKRQDIIKVSRLISKLCSLETFPTGLKSVSPPVVVCSTPYRCRRMASSTIQQRASSIQRRRLVRSLFHSLRRRLLELTIPRSLNLCRLPTSLVGFLHATWCDNACCPTFLLVCRTRSCYHIEKTACIILIEIGRIPVAVITSELWARDKKRIAIVDAIRELKLSIWKIRYVVARCANCPCYCRMAGEL